MNDKLDILFSKVFCRMRHKTQLFNGSADDHYHTRLQHTIEVEDIALKMASKIMTKYSDVVIDLNKISKIALLHDIGHTPFGHAGERALHEIVSGKCCHQYDLPNFRSAKLTIGFKHNLNSGLLYSEATTFSNIDLDVLDGIVKHTKLTQGKRSKLDYGFEYIFSNRNGNYKIKEPATSEGLIVAFADEIAQVCSDYLDISLDAESHKGFAVFDCPPFNNIFVASSEKRVIAKTAANYLIDLFAKCYVPNINLRKIKRSAFGIQINDFDIARSDYISKNRRIANYDKKKKKVIKTLYSVFYHYPNEMNNDFFGDFSFRVKRIKLITDFVVNEAAFSTSCKSDILNYIQYVSGIVFSKTPKVSKSRLKDYRSILKLYNRSIAVYISKMTDNYADHKYQKYKRKYKKLLTLFKD